MPNRVTAPTIIVAITLADFHGYLGTCQQFSTRKYEPESSLQDTAPVETENKDGKTATVQCETDPVEVEEQVFRKLLTVQHAKGGWVCTRIFTLACRRQYNNPAQG